MTTTRFFVPLALGVLVGLWLSHTTLLSPAHSQEAKKKESTTAPAADAKTKPAADEDPEVKLVRASAAEFQKAYNAGNAKAIAALFGENAEVVDEDENMVTGRANIEARFAEIFKEYPKAKIEVEVGSIRRLSADVAIEEGNSTVTLDSNVVPSRSPYAIVHIKREGKWHLASVRDFPEEDSDTPRDHLNDLAWLVGNWVDESRDGRVETACRWSEDGNFLLQDYTVKTRNGDVMKGIQRIGWDPLRRTIRAWVFDNTGGIIESTWTEVDGGWVTKVEGTTADGDAVSATRILTQVSNDAFTLDSSSQIVGGQLLPDSSVKVVRQPPKPKD